MTDTIQFNPLAIQQQVKEQSDLATKQLAAFTGMVISSPEEAAQATQFLQGIMRQKDAVDEMLRGATGPLQKAEKEIRSWFKPAQQSLSDLVTLFKRAIGDFHSQQALAQQQAFKLAAQAAESGDKASLDAALAKSVEVAPTKLDGASVRQVWKAEIINAGLVPYSVTVGGAEVQLLVPDIIAIRNIAKLTPPDREPPIIPGVKWTLDSQMTVRR